MDPGSHLTPPQHSLLPAVSVTASFLHDFTFSYLVERGKVSMTYLPNKIHGFLKKKRTKEARDSKLLPENCLRLGAPLILAL